MPHPESDSWKATRGRRSAVNAMQSLQELVPIPRDDKSKLDLQQAFFLYCSFAGDIERVAVAMHADAAELRRIIAEHQWAEKLEPLMRLRNGQRPGDLERGLSRTQNFVQAHRMRLILERLIKRFSTMSEDELAEYCFVTIRTTHKDGSVTEEKKLSTRPFADLTAALEKVHAMCYLALNDTVSERKARDEEAPGASPQDIHAAIAEAMSQIGESPRELALAQKLSEAEDKNGPLIG